MLTAVVLAAAATSTLIVMRYLRVMHNHLVEHFDRDIYHLGAEFRMSNQDVVDAVTAELGKVRIEITSQADGLRAKIAELQSQVDAGVPAEQLDLSGLQAAAQSLDDIVPDAVPVDVPADVPADVPVDAPVDPAV